MRGCQRMLLATAASFLVATPNAPLTFLRMLQAYRTSPRRTQKPEVKRRKADYLAHYRGRPEVKERLHNHRQRPEYKDWMREYNQRPERKAWFKIPVKCECGIMSSNGHISRHRKSAQHDHRLAGTREVEQ